MMLTDALKLNPFKTVLSLEEMLDWRAQLGREANRRLKRLEGARSKVTGESLTYGAYRAAAEMLKMDTPRFREDKIGVNYNQVRAEILKAQSFLNMKTSTITGATEVERKRIATFRSGKYGSKAHGGLTGVQNAGSKDFYDFLNSGLLDKKLYNFLSSDTIVDLYARGIEEGRTSEEIVEIMQEAFEEYRVKTAPASIKDLSKRLGVNWI